MSDAKYVLDGHALLALLGDEPGADTVARILAEHQGTGSVLMSMINLGEAYYIFLRERAAAEELARSPKASCGTSNAKSGAENAALS